MDPMKPTTLERLRLALAFCEEHQIEPLSVDFCAMGEDGRSYQPHTVGVRIAEEDFRRVWEGSEVAYLRSYTADYDRLVKQVGPLIVSTLVRTAPAEPRPVAVRVTV